MRERLHAAKFRFFLTTAELTEGLFKMQYENAVRLYKIDAALPARD